MSKISLIFKLIFSLRIKAVVLVLLTTVSGLAAVYVSALYKEPKNYSAAAAGLAKQGDFLYFDTLGEKVSSEELLGGNNIVRDIIYVYYVANTTYDGVQYYVKAISSVNGFVSKNISERDGGGLPEIVPVGNEWKKIKPGEVLNFGLSREGTTKSFEFEFLDFIPSDDLYLALSSGSTAISYYQLFSRDCNDIFVLMNSDLQNSLEAFGLEGSQLLSSNGIILLNKNAEESEISALKQLLIENNITVQSSRDIAETTNQITQNILSACSGLPILILALSIFAGISVVLIIIDCNLKHIYLMEMVGASKNTGRLLLAGSALFMLLPGLIINGCIIILSADGCISLFDNVNIDFGALLPLAVLLIVYFAICFSEILFLTGRKSHIENKKSKFRSL